MFTFDSISGPFLFGKDMPTILGLRLWLEKINKIKSCMEVWKSRDLTYFGKILIIKSFVLSVIIPFI
jgi:hypothetical protein